MDAKNIASHEPPGDADFLIHILLDDHGMPDKAEQLWVRQLDEFEFLIRSIPFYPYGIGPGDIVQTDEKYVVKRVVKRSDSHVLRATVPRPQAEPFHDRLHHELMTQKLSHEWRGFGYVAVELSSIEIPGSLRNLLDDLAKDLGAQYEVSTNVSL